MRRERNHQRKYDVTRKIMEKIMDENELFATYEHKFTIRASRISRSPNIDEYRLNYAGAKAKVPCTNKQRNTIFVQCNTHRVLHMRENLLILMITV